MRLIFLIFFSSLLKAQWVKLSDFPGTKRDDGIAVIVGDKAYFGVGLQEGWWLADDFYALDLVNFTWGSLFSMPQQSARQYATAFPGIGCFYIFGGEGSGTVLNNMYRYDISANTWTTAASKPGNGLMAASCMVFGDKVIICGGKIAGPGPASKEVWQYTISTDTWTKKNDYPFSARWRSSATVLNNYGYLLFGIDDSNSYRKELYRYDPVADNWTQEPDFPGDGRAYAAMQANKKLVVFGGHGNQNIYFNDVWYYNDVTNTWSAGPVMPALARRGDMSCLKDEKFIFSCGLGQGDVRLKETWLLDVPVAIEENKAGETFTVFPNPVENSLCILTNNKNMVLHLYDVSGREMMVDDLNNINTEERIIIDIRNLTPGIYFLNVDEGGIKTVTKKIVKQ